MSQISLSQVFYHQDQNPTPELTVGLILFLVSQQSAFFEPSKQKTSQRVINSNSHHLVQSEYLILSTPDLGAWGTLYDTGKLCIFTSNEDGTSYFIYKTRRNCRKRVTCWEEKEMLAFYLKTCNLGVKYNRLKRHFKGILFSHHLPWTVIFPRVLAFPAELVAKHMYCPESSAVMLSRIKVQEPSGSSMMMWWGSASTGRPSASTCTTRVL